jgi:hypothetical protein
MFDGKSMVVFIAESPKKSPWGIGDSGAEYIASALGQLGAAKKKGGIPSSKHTKSYWKWPFIVYQRVTYFIA